MMWSVIARDLIAGNSNRKGSMGIWDKPVKADGKLNELEGFVFEVKSAAIRPNVHTQYGTKDALDLVVTIDGKDYTYSGFSAGIIAQVRNADDGDFPFRATVEKIAVKNGTTLNLVPAGDDVELTLEAPAPEELFPADDDIPF